MTLTEFFEQGYFYFLITIFGLILVLGTFLTSLIKIKKLPIIQLVLLVLFICIILFKPMCVWVFKLTPRLKDIDLHFDLYTTILSLVLVIASHAAYLVFTKGTLSSKSIYVLAPNYLGRPVYAYINQNGKLLSYTEDFFNELNVSFKEENKWYKEVSDFAINGASYEYADFLLKIKEQEENNFKITLQIATEEISLNVEKIAIEEQEEIIGYVIAASQTVKPTDGSDGFMEIMGSLSMPFAYYNDDKRGVTFIVNKAFKELLGLKGQTLGYEELKKYVYGEDIPNFENSVNTIDGENTFIYRLETNDGIKTFKENKKFSEEKVTIIISVSEEVETKLNEKKDLLAFCDESLKEGKEFGSCLISINDINTIVDENGIDITKELANKYFEYLEKNIIHEKDMIVKISDLEYCLVFGDILTFDSIVRDISKDTSNLLKYNIQYNDKKYEITNVVGIVYSEHISSSEELMNALDEALSFANQESYDKNYCIYSPKKVDGDAEKVDYNFEDLSKIDLDNSFLDDETEEQKETEESKKVEDSTDNDDK